MCRPSVTYYSCDCVKASGQSKCANPGPSCSRGGQTLEEKTLDYPCREHDPSKRTQPQPHRSNTFRPIDGGILASGGRNFMPSSPVSPISVFSETGTPWSAVSTPTREDEPWQFPVVFNSPKIDPATFGTGQSLMRRPNVATRRRPSSRAQRHNSPARVSGMSATMNPAVDLPRMNMPVRNRASVYNLQGFQHEREPSPPLPEIRVSRRKVHHTPARPGGVWPPPINTKVHSGDAHRSNSSSPSGVSKPRSPPSRTPASTTATHGQHQSGLRADREAPRPKTTQVSDSGYLDWKVGKDGDKKDACAVM